MNSLIKLSLLSLTAVGAAACGHEGRVTGPTQCLAPHASHAARVARASEVIQARADLAERTATQTATF